MRGQGDSDAASSVQSFSSMFIMLGATKRRPQPHSSSRGDDERATRPRVASGTICGKSTILGRTPPWLVAVRPPRLNRFDVTPDFSHGGMALLERPNT